MQIKVLGSDALTQETRSRLDAMQGALPTRKSFVMQAHEAQSTDCVMKLACRVSKIRWCMLCTTRGYRRITGCCRVIGK